MLGFCVAFLVESATAQTIAMSYTITPKAGTGAGFETALKQHMEWRTENGDPWVWLVYQVETGDNLGAYIVRSAGHTWGDIDTYEASPFAPRSGTHFGATVQPLMATISNSIGVMDANNSRLPPDISTANLFQVTTYNVKPGQQFAFNAVVARFHDVISKNDYPLYYVSTTPATGPGPAATLVFFQDDWASFADPDGRFLTFLADQLGESGAQQLFSDFGDTFTSLQSEIVRLRRDLSMTPNN
jgi:hypothetical protein